MKQLSILILALVLLTSCQPTRQTTARPVPPPAPPTIAQPPKKAQEDKAVAALRQGAALVRELTLQPDDTLPDALLNRTRCFVVELSDHSEGMSSCRTEAAPYSWSTPEMVELKGLQASGGDVLAFVLSERGVEALNNGGLDLAKVSVSAGKTVKQAALSSGRDLAHDVVTYRYSQSILSGADVSHVVIKRLARQVGDETPGGGAEPTTAMPSNAAGEYLDWVKSYFNAVTPTGIIIHHSAAIPSQGKVPTALKEIDDFHAERGLAIECLGREYHVAYHYLIFPNGKVQAGRPERCEGAHARGYNSYIGISLVGDFSPADNPSGRKGPLKPTRKQLQSLVQLTRQLQQKYDIPMQRILRHSDVASTRCPGENFAFKDFLLAVKQPQPGLR